MSIDTTISVIIPVLNEEENIGRLIDRLHEIQSGYLHEIIVVDGGSIDNTAEIAVNRNARLVRQTKPGRAMQMNAGAAQATGKILYFLHADSIPPPGFDTVIAHKMNEGYRCGCFRLKFDDPHPLLRFYSYFTKYKTTLVRFGDQSLYVEKSLFDTIKGFDETLAVMEDQIIVRKLKEHAVFGLIDQPVATSSRKYRRVGVVKLQLLFAWIWLGYYLGARQETLLHFYNRFIGSERTEQTE